MEMAKHAQEVARQSSASGTPMIYLNIGEPDFSAPPLVQEAAERAIRGGRTQYTQAPGLPELRERISAWYASRFGVDVPARRIIITAGASAALQLACLALIDEGDEVLMPDPSYPCNRHFVSAAEGKPVLILLGGGALPAQRRQGRSGLGRAHARRDAGLASNPTGTSIAPDELRRIHEVVRAKGGLTIVDEIYLGLSYDEAYGQSALKLGDDIISINSFSKYFNMTGWRLGWMVVPESLVAPIEMLAQHLFICASTVSQYAALACFEPESIAEYERRRAEFKARRDYFIPALESIGLPVPVKPDGAFYAWADCRAAAEKLGVKGSWDLPMR
jgi:aspartate/methionine/tyrosine aminotransferase